MPKIQPNLTQDLELLKDELKPLEKSNKLGQFVGRIVRKLENAFNRLEHLFKEGKWESKEIRGYHELKQKIEQVNKDWEKASSTYHSKSAEIIPDAKEEYIKFNQEMKQNLSTMSEIFEVIENKIGDNKKKANDLTLIQQIVKNLKVSIDKEIEFVNQQGGKVRTSQTFKKEGDSIEQPKKEISESEASVHSDESESSSESAVQKKWVKGEVPKTKAKALNTSRELKGKGESVSEEESSPSIKKRKNSKSKEKPTSKEELTDTADTPIKEKKADELAVPKKTAQKEKELKFQDLESTDFDPLKKSTKRQ